MRAALLLLLLFAAVVNVAPCKDGEDCPENPESLPIGGRDGFCPECGVTPEGTVSIFANETCEVFNTDCICRNIQETCYADFGIAYDIWLAVMFLIQSSVLVWLYILLKESAAKRKKGAKYSSMEKLMIMNAVATSFRLLWYIVIIPGRNGSVMLGGAVTDSILLKVPQLIWCGAMFFMASTWKMLHDQSANMKKANPKEQEKLDRICNYVNIGMICIVVPAYIVGNVLGVAILNTFVNLFQTATIMFLIVAAIFFGTKLAKELGDEGPGAALGKVIKKSMWIAVAGGVVMILAVVANMMGLTKGGGAKTFIFWTCIHFPEYVESRILLEMKISQRKKVVAETKTNKSTMSTTTSSADP